MVEGCCWRRREIECTPMVHCNNVCDLGLTVIFLWDVLMILHALWPSWDFLKRFHAFWHLSQNKHGCFKIVGGLWLVARRLCKGMLERVSSGERGGWGRGGWWWICWEGARVVCCAWSLSCLFCRPRYLIKVLPPSFFALTVNELRLFFMLFVPHIFVLDFLTGICYLWPSWDFLMIFHAFGCIIFLWDFLMRVQAFCYVIFIWDFLMRFHTFWPLWDFMRFPCEFSSFLTSMRFPCEISCFLAS